MDYKYASLRLNAHDRQSPGKEHKGVTRKKQKKERARKVRLIKRHQTPCLHCFIGRTRVKADSESVEVE